MAIGKLTRVATIVISTNWRVILIHIIHIIHDERGIVVRVWLVIELGFAQPAVAVAVLIMRIIAFVVCKRCIIVVGA